MKKTLITGASGLIGRALSLYLAGQGRHVVALVRRPGALPETIEQIRGDINQPDTLRNATRGVETVYHLAGYTLPWAKDPATYHNVNVEGAGNVFQAAADNGVRRVVFTSTAGVFGPSPDGEPVSESSPPPAFYHTEYERSKVRAEALARQWVQKGLDIVTVNPSRVFGPGPLGASNGTARMIKLYLEGRFRLLPDGGPQIGNYVYLDDVVQGHVLAMERGAPGERYALGGENLSLKRIIELTRNVSGVHHKVYPLPGGLLRTAARIMQARAKWLGIPPLLTPEWVDRYNERWLLSSQKAVDALGYRPRSMQEGIACLVRWLDLSAQSSHRPSS